MRPVEPVLTAHRFAGLHDHLLALLRTLSTADWQKPTACRDWNVRDIAAHILDTQVRLLSLGRDRMAPPPPDVPIDGYPSLVGYLNQLNADWVRATRRMSPRLLTEFLSITGPALADHVTSLDPDAPALFPVAWAGDLTSPNWFDIGRNYTEYWHHQQQIRDAVGAPPLTAREWLYPVLALFLRALPHAYRATPATEGQALIVEITGEAGGQWSLVRDAGAWQLFDGEAPDPLAHVSLTDDTAWRLFTKGLNRSEAAARSRISGDQALGAVFLNTLAIMA